MKQDFLSFLVTNTLQPICVHIYLTGSGNLTPAAKTAILATAVAVESASFELLSANLQLCRNTRKGE